MKCGKIEPLLCDYLDRSLEFEARREVEFHLLECPACSEAVADIEFARDFMRDAPAVEPPPQLIADIIHDTIGIGGPLPQLSPGGGPSGGLFGFLRPIFHPFVQPRLVMSMAMSLVSVTMLAYYGKDLRQGVDQAQMAPAAVVESVQQNAGEFWTEAVEVYETMRLLYELQTGKSGAVEEWNRAPAGPPAGGAEQNQ